MALTDRFAGLARGVVSAAQVHTGAMIALVPRDAESLAVGNEPADNLHVTLSYLGEAADLTPAQRAKILEMCEGLAQQVPLKARVSGIAHLNGECTVILVDSKELRDLQTDVEAVIGTKSSYPGYLPHVTVDYGDEVLDVGDLPEEIEFSHLRVALAGENHDFDGLALTADLLGKAKGAVDKVSRVWDEALHPRAKDGRWIEKGGFVRGVMTFMGPDGKPQVRRGVVAKVVDIRNGVVHVEDKRGNRGVASARTLDEAEPPKARIDTPWMHSESTAKKNDPVARRAWTVKAMSDEAIKLTEDPEQRIPILNKIMGGLRGSPLTTVYDHNKQGPSGDEWSDERMAKHEEMWDALLERIEAAGVPKERRALVLGGPPGAGKSYSLRPGEPAAELGVVGWDLTGEPPAGATHVVMNPDVIKELMIEFDMLPPDLPKQIRPREAASITHAESNFLTMLFMSRLAALDINTVYDSTMANRAHVEKNIRALAEAGYTFQGLYVKIPKTESETSARNRYIEESLADPELGGRFVPSEASSAWDTEGTFKQFQSWFTDGWLMVDNTDLTKGRPRKEIYAEGTGNGSGLAHFLSPMPPPEARPKRPPTRAGDPRQRPVWGRPAAPSVIEPVPGKPKPVMWKPGMKLDDEGNVIIAAGAPHFLPLYTDTQAAIGLFSAALSPDEYLELLRSNLVLVTPPVDDEEDYLWATTVFHEINRLGRGGISFDVGDEYNRLRSEGLMRDTYDSLTAAAWDPLLHPRGKDGKFIRVNGWIKGTFRLLETGKTVETTARVSHFKPSGNPEMPFVVVDTPDGPAIASVKRVEEAAGPKASLIDLGKGIVGKIGQKRDEFQMLLPEGKPFGEFKINELYGPDKGSPSKQMAAIEAKATEMGAIVDDEVLKRLDAQNMRLLGPEEWQSEMDAIKSELAKLVVEHGQIRESLEDPTIEDPTERMKSGAIAALTDPAAKANWAKQEALIAKKERIDNNRQIYRTAYSKMLREVLSEVVDGGLGGPAKTLYFQVNGQAEADHRSVLAETVEAVYPSSWIAASNNHHLPLSIKLDTKRAHYQPKTGQMRTYPKDSKNAGQTLVHEFGHRMEEAIPGLKPLEYAFYWRRVGNEAKSQMAPGEWTRTDEFPTAYMGKDYGAGMLSNYELFTVGAEVLLSPHVAKGSYGVRGLLEDKDYRSWFIGTIVALTGPQAAPTKNLTLADDIGSDTDDLGVQIPEGDWRNDL